MKRLIILLLFISPFISFAQDSAKVKVSIVLQARDCEYIANAIQFEPKFEDMDSVFKAKWRVAVSPTGTANVTIDGIQVRHLLSVSEKLNSDAMAIDQKVLERFDTAIRAASNNWLTVRLDRKLSTQQDIYQAMRQTGRKRLKKENDE